MNPSALQYAVSPEAAPVIVLPITIITANSKYYIDSINYFGVGQYEYIHSFVFTTDRIENVFESIGIIAGIEYGAILGTTIFKAKENGKANNVNLLSLIFVSKLWKL